MQLTSNLSIQRFNMLLRACNRVGGAVWKLEAEGSKLKEIDCRMSAERFGYEDLQVWRRSVNFAILVIDVIDRMDMPRKHYRLIEQLEAACTSVAQNLAEDKGRFSRKEFVHFCYIARGSLYETMTLPEIFKRKNWLSAESFHAIKSEGLEIASMIKGLINSLSN